MRGCARETQPSVWLHENQLSRDANIKRIETFHVHFEKFRYTFQILVDAYFGASIHLILFFVSNHGKQENMVNKTEKKCGIYKRHFLYAQLKFVGLK